MPRKKLTKAQVKRKMKSLITTLADLSIDKLYHIDSKVPFSGIAMNELMGKIHSAAKRIK